MNYQLISIQLSCLTFKNIINHIVALGSQHRSSYVCVANVHMLIEAHNSPGFASVVNKADLITPDGMPLIWGLRLLYGIRQERVAGMDLLPDLLSSAEEMNHKVFFYGGTVDMMDATEIFLSKNFPSLKYELYSPPFRKLTEAEDIEVIRKINESGPNLVFVALGCPKQENWMAAMKGKINACMIGIGGALPVMIGIQSRAPDWMQKAGLEWFYRLIQEPKRLFKRYAITNTTFIWLLVKAIAKQGFRAKPQQT